MHAYKLREGFLFLAIRIFLLFVFSLDVCIFFVAYDKIIFLFEIYAFEGYPPKALLFIISILSHLLSEFTYKTNTEKQVMTLTGEKIAKIKLIVTDVDGVLTDGGFYYTEEGIALKKFNVKDGMGFLLLKQNGFLTGIITTDKTGFITARAERIKPDFLIAGTWNKLEELNSKLKELSLDLSETAYIGDDVNDLEIISAVGFSAAPADATDAVLEKVDYVCRRNGGNGAFREFADLFLSGEN